MSGDSEANSDDTTRGSPIFDNLQPGIKITAEYLRECKQKLEDYCEHQNGYHDKEQSALDGRELIGILLGHSMKEDPAWMHRWMRHNLEDSTSSRDIDLPLSPDAMGTQLSFLNDEERSKLIKLQTDFCGVWEPGQHQTIPEHMLPPFYTIASPLGDGTYATVDQVQLIKSSSQPKGLKYARKRPKDSSRDMLANELETLKNMAQHHHVVRCVGSYSHKGLTNILLEPVADKGNLSQYLNKSKSNLSKFTRKVLMKSFGCLISGLGFLSTTMRHKDIKPDNILVHGATVLFTDFGSAYNFEKNKIGSATSNTAPGSINWMYAAPEVRIHKGQRDVKTDLFSLGCVFAEIIAVLAEDTKFTRLYPHADYGTHVDELHKWLDNVKEKTKETKSALSMPIEWCKRMTQKELVQRPKIPELISEMRRQCGDKETEYFCDQCREKAMDPPLPTVIEEQNESPVSSETPPDLNVNELDIYGRTALSRAARHGSRSTVRLLLDAGAKTDGADPIEQGTALHWAVQGGSQDIVKLLLEGGANIDAYDPFVGSPLSWAVQNERVGVVELLLTRGADVSATNKTGLTPLHLAAQTDNTVLIELLLNKGADIMARDESQRTPRQLAVESGSEAAIKLLLEKEKSVSPTIRGPNNGMDSIGSNGRNLEATGDKQKESIPIRSAMRSQNSPNASRPGSKRAMVVEPPSSPGSRSIDES